MSNDEKEDASAAAVATEPKATVVILPPRETVPSSISVEETESWTTTDGTPAVDTSMDAALAAALAQEEGEEIAAPSTPSYTVATASAPWQYDDLHPTCYMCREPFHPLNRKHHCRYCGNVVCHNCSSKKALIPPSRIVLAPVTGKKAKPPDYTATVSFSPNPDPDRMLTYVATNNNDVSASSILPSGEGEQLLYGRGLEERFQLAREPLRVCHPCHAALQPLQEELRAHNSHAMRYNYVDPTHPARLFNSPFANTLGHEIRKAAYALNNLLPQPKRRAGALIESNPANNPIAADLQQCKDTCSTISPNLGDLDGVQIPVQLLEQAKGVAVLTVLKGGLGLAGVEYGTGLVVARLPGGLWSAPSALSLVGLSWGALLGAQVSDHVFLLMSDAAVALLYNNTASVQLGADVGLAVGPVGRALEGDWGVGEGRHPAPIYTYSLSKGLYAGISLDGKVISTRADVNEKFYGLAVSAEEILAGAVPTPPAAQPLYDALHRCHVYAVAAAHRTARPWSVPMNGPLPPAPTEEHVGLSQEYGEWLPPPRVNGAHVE
jgi:SH3 domain-containing YSC84-like protein 1